jgi:hypothetical protein
MNTPTALTLTEFAAVSSAVSKIVALLGIPVSTLASLLDSPKHQVEMCLSGVATDLLDRSDRHQDLVQLVRMYTALCAILPVNEQARSWFHGDNLALPGVPLELIATRDGLSTVVSYLEAEGI